MTLTEYIIFAVIKIALLLFILLTAVAYIVLLERKVIARMQNRWGPNRVGPFGLLQPLADGIKFILKEDIIPDGVYKPLYVAAPMIALILSLVSISVIPFGGVWKLGNYRVPLETTGFWNGAHVQDINIGLLIILGITSIGVYGVALSGWSSNSKYSLLGSLRAPVSEDSAREERRAVLSTHAVLTTGTRTTGVAGGGETTNTVALK